MIEYEKDVTLLKRKIHRLRQLTDEEVDSMYREYCRTQWRAGWMELWSGDDSIFRGFREWMEGEGKND